MTYYEIKNKPIFDDLTEFYGDVYKCPFCNDINIWEGFKYCPNCGKKLNWEGVVKKCSI